MHERTKRKQKGKGWLESGKNVGIDNHENRFADRNAWRADGLRHLGQHAPRGVQSGSSLAERGFSNGWKILDAAGCSNPRNEVHGWREIMENIGVFACFSFSLSLAGRTPHPGRPSIFIPSFLRVFATPRELFLPPSFLTSYFLLASAPRAEAGRVRLGGTLGREGGRRRCPGRGG